VKILENIKIRKIKNQSILLIWRQDDLGVENYGLLELICTAKIKVAQSVNMLNKKNREYFQ
jgi:hypothetical protein